MVDLRRWIQRTTPHLFLAGVVSASLAGCQSAQTVETVNTSPGTVEDTDIAPAPAPTPPVPYEELPVLPAPPSGDGEGEADAGQPDENTTTVTKSDSVPPPPEAGFENAEPKASTAESVAKTEVTPVKPETSDLTEPDTTAEETKPTKPTTTETVVSTPDSETPVSEGVAETKAAPTLPTEVEPNPNEPVKALFPETLPETVVEDRVPTPETAAPVLPESLPKTDPAVTVEQVPENETPEPETKPGPLTLPETTEPTPSESETTSPLLPESTEPEAKPLPQADTTQPETRTDEPAARDSNADEPPEPADKPLPFSDAGEATVPTPNRPQSDDTEPTPVKPEAGKEKPILPETGGEPTTRRSNDPFIQLPEITPGPRQPEPAETPIPTSRTVARRDDRVASRNVDTLRLPIGTVPEPREFTESSKNDTTVKAVEIATFGGSADGIVFDADGTAFVSHRDSISKVTLDGEVSHWAKSGAPRGHAILRDGTHLICDAAQRAVLQLDSDGTLLRKVVTKSDGYFLRAPNDLAVDSEGGFYFTDPGYARIRNAIGKIHYVAADGTTSVVAQKLAFPEGIAISPDGSKLFVAESQKNRVVEFEIQSAGKLGPKEIFSEMPRSRDGDSDNFVDGIAVDREGWLYVAHRGMSRVEVIGPDGDWRTSFACPGTIVRNLAFSRDYSKLFVTGADRKRRTAGRLMIIDFAGR